MDRVCIHADLNSNVISTALSERTPKASQASVDMQCICNFLPKLLHSIHNIRPPLCLSLHTKLVIEKCLLGFRKYFQKMNVSLKSNKEFRKRSLSIVMPVCLSVRLCVSMKQLFCLWMCFHEIYLKQFPKICRENTTIIKI